MSQTQTCPYSFHHSMRIKRSSSARAENSDKHIAGKQHQIAENSTNPASNDKNIKFKCKYWIFLFAEFCCCCGCLVWPKIAGKKMISFESSTKDHAWHLHCAYSTLLHTAKWKSAKKCSLHCVQMIFLIKKEFLRCSGIGCPSPAILLTEKIKTSQWRKLCGYIRFFPFFFSTKDRMFFILFNQHVKAHTTFGAGILILISSKTILIEIVGWPKLSEHKK